MLGGSSATICPGAPAAARHRTGPLLVWRGGAGGLTARCLPGVKQGLLCVEQGLPCVEQGLPCVEQGLPCVEQGLWIRAHPPLAPGLK